METKNCPFCGEDILTIAKKCKHCGEWLEGDDECEKDDTVPHRKSYAGWIFLCILGVISLFGTLPFHYVLKDGEGYDPQTGRTYTIKNAHFRVFPKEHFTFSNTFIVQNDIDNIIKRYNNANLLEQQAIRQEPLAKKLIEKKIIGSVDDCSKDDFRHDLYERTKQLDDNISKTKHQISNTYTYEQLENDTKNNLITPTSIAGIEVIGKTLQDVKPYFDKDLIWEYVDDYEEANRYLVKRGNIVFFEFCIFENKIFSVCVLDPAFVTADGFHIGSTSGDILRKYPKATVCNTEYGGDYTVVNRICYGYDENVSVGEFEYGMGEESEIVNKNVKITSIGIRGYR